MENHSTVIPTPPTPKIPRDLQRPTESSLQAPTQIPTQSAKKTNMLGYILGATFLILLGIVGFAYDSSVQKLEEYVANTVNLDLESAKDATNNQDNKENQINQSSVQENQQKNQIADWKTFSNSSMGISFDYPREYGIMYSDETTVVLGAHHTPEDPEITEYLRITTKPLFQVQSYPGSKEDRKVGGAPSITFFQGPDAPQEEHIIQTNGDQQFQFIMKVDGGGLEDTFQKILDTVKFESPVSSRVSTYTHQGFSISYPYTWNIRESLSDSQFMEGNFLTGFENIVVLENAETYLIIGRNPLSNREVGGVFYTAGEFQSFVERTDQITIQGKKYYVSKYQDSIVDWKRPNTQLSEINSSQGLNTKGSVSKYVVDKEMNAKGQSMNGFDLLIKMTKSEFSIIKFSKIHRSVTLTTPETQKEIKSILESIVWE